MENRLPSLFLHKSSIICNERKWPLLDMLSLFFEELKIETLNLIIIGTHCYQPYVLGPTLQISVSKFMGLNEEKGSRFDTPFCYPWLKALYHTFATHFFPFTSPFEFAIAHKNESPMNGGFIL